MGFITSPPSPPSRFSNTSHISSPRKLPPHSRLLSQKNKQDTVRFNAGGRARAGVRTETKTQEYQLPGLLLGLLSCFRAQELGQLREQRWREIRLRKYERSHRAIPWNTLVIETAALPRSQHSQLPLTEQLVNLFVRWFVAVVTFHPHGNTSLRRRHQFRHMGVIHVAGKDSRAHSLPATPRTKSGA